MRSLKVKYPTLGTKLNLKRTKILSRRKEGKADGRPELDQ